MSLAKTTIAAKPTQIRTVLVVDDSPDQLFLFQKAFEKAFRRATLVQSTTPQQAIDYLNQCLLEGGRVPELIFLDLFMPQRQDGWRVLEAIRSMPAPVNNLPVIMLSSSDDPVDIYASYDRSITSYIIKPLAVEDWENYFQTLSEYWNETISLPGQRLF